MNNIKLGVEVIGAHGLLPKDGTGAANTFVELNFDDQKHRTVVKDNDLNPFWNEQFYFTITDPSALPGLVLEAFVYHVNRTTKSKSCLGKLRITGTSFVGLADAAPMYYPLEKKGAFSRVQGELGLKIFLTDDPSAKPSNPNPDAESFLTSPSIKQAHVQPTQSENSGAHRFSGGRTAPTRQFHHLSREQKLPQRSTEPQQYAEIPSRGIPFQYVGDKIQPEAPHMLRTIPEASQQPIDFQLKETTPILGGRRVIHSRLRRVLCSWIKPGSRPGAHDLVECMRYLYVHVVKARNLPNMDVTGSLDPYVEVRLGNYVLKTKYFDKNKRPEWDEVFAFPQECLQSTTLEIILMDKDLVRDDFVGKVQFNLNEVPTRIPPESPLAPEWYRLENNHGERTKGELMLAIWVGTQADECFPYALHADSIFVDPSLISHIRGKVYPAPRLWYLRVHVIAAQDIIVHDKHRIPEVFVKARVGNIMLRTRGVRSQTTNFVWNEDHVLVVAEPFEEDLILSAVDHVGANKHEEIGTVEIPLKSVPRRADKMMMIPPVWFSLHKSRLINVDQLQAEGFSGKIHLRICLEGGYHVFDEPISYASDLRPTMKQLWKPPIGVLELGILGVNGLPPMKTRHGHGTCDAYCVAKYGQKWVRTRTIMNSLNPKFNEQYMWDVHDHGTVLTVGVFDNHHLREKHNESNGYTGHRDSIIGKVRIRLSTLEIGRIYTHSYPLIILHNSGVKKMGELHLAVRFSETHWLNFFLAYTKPLLPKMHYIHPLSLIQQSILRHQAVQIVAERLGRMEPPVPLEVVEYISDAHSHQWSMRRSKANFFRLKSVFSGVIAAAQWLTDVCWWKNPITTVLVHVLLTMLVCFPQLILPTIFLYMLLIGLWSYRFRPKYPPHMDIRLSHADMIHPDELDEEFDTFPSTRSPELIKLRYDRLRHLASKIQITIGDVATLGERLLSLLSWRDPRATAMFLVFCTGAAVTLYVTPFQVVALGLGFYNMRHPWLRRRVPIAPINFFRRLPSQSDCLL